MIKRLLTTVMLMLLIVFLPSSYAKEIPSELQYQNVKISPDGKILALSLTIEGLSSLVFRDRSTNKVLGFTNFPEKLLLGDYQWVNNERVVFKIHNKEEWSDKPQFYGELYAINFDGSKSEVIYGYSIGEKQTGSRSKKKKSIFGWGDIIDTLPDDKKHILISSTPMNSKKESLATVYKLNVYTGIIKNKLAKSPLPLSTFIINAAGDLAGVVGKTTNNQQQLFLRKNDRWESVNEATLGNNFNLILHRYSDEYLYLFDDDSKGQRGLYRLNIADNSYEAVNFELSVSDFEKFNSQQTNKTLRLGQEFTEFLLLNKQKEDARVYQQLISTFPNKSVTINSKTSEDDIFIIAAYKNDSTGDFYLFNKEKNQLKYLHNFVNSSSEAEFSPIDSKKQMSYNDPSQRINLSGF